MSWFDSLRSGIDNFIGGRHQGPGVPAPAAPEPAKAPPTDPGWGNSGWAKTLGISPWAKKLGVGQGNTPAGTPLGGGASVGDMRSGGVRKMGDGSVSTSGMIRKKGGSGFKRGKDGGFELPKYGNWGGRASGRGNRKVDQEAAKKGGYEAAMPEIYQPDLSGIPRTTTGQVRADHKGADKKNDATSGAGAFRDSAYGSSHTSWDDLKKGFLKTKVGPDGKAYTDIATAKAAWGAEEKGGYRALAISDNKRHHAQAEAGWVASGGASAQGTINTKDGIQLQAGLGGKAGLYASGDAKTSTGDLTLGGEKYNAGLTASGDVFAGVKAGMGGQVGFGPEFAGAKGNIGAFAGAEAQGKVGGNLGPVGGTVGGSVMAGAGIGAEGDISYEDGKFHIGGKMFAALGYGGALSGDVTIDVGAMGRTLTSWGGDALDWAGDRVDDIGSGLSSVGSSIASGASAVGGAISSGASAVGGAISSGASSAYDAVTDW